MRALLGHGGADQSLTDLEPEVRRGLWRIADRVRDLQLASLLIEHVDGERLKGDEARDELGNARQQLVERQDRGHLTAEIEQRGDEVLFGGDKGYEIVAVSAIKPQTLKPLLEKIGATIRRG